MIEIARVRTNAKAFVSPQIVSEVEAWAQGITTPRLDPIKRLKQDFLQMLARTDIGIAEETVIFNAHATGSLEFEDGDDQLSFLEWLKDRRGGNLVVLACFQQEALLAVIDDLKARFSSVFLTNDLHGALVRLC
jgi:hypothetical protein